MNRLEVHQLAREIGLDRAALARLYNADPPLLATDKQNRVITESGRLGPVTMRRRQRAVGGVS